MVRRIAALLPASLLVACGGSLTGLESPSYDPSYARAAAAQGRPTGAWASGTCDLANMQSCVAVCTTQNNVDGCNDVAVLLETGMGGRMSALSQYRMACMRGSAGACFNQARIQAGRSWSQTMTEESAAVQQQGGQLAQQATQLSQRLSDVAAGRTASASGRLDARGASGAWSATLDACASGEPEGFFGVDLASTTGGVVLRVVPDPIVGPRARLSRAGSEPVALDPKTCSVLTANVRKSGTRVDTVVLLDGDVALDCKLPDGTNIVAQATFSQCQRSAVVAAARASSEPTASAPLVADHYDRPALPPELRALRVRVTGRIAGATLDGESPEEGSRKCGASSEAFFRDMGLAVVPGPDADVWAEVTCAGHVTLEDTGSELRIVRPASDGVAMTLRHDGQVVDTFPPGPSALRCVFPGTREQRQSACIARVEQMSSARIAGLLAASQPLAKLARSLKR